MMRSTRTITVIIVNLPDTVSYKGHLLCCNVNLPDTVSYKGHLLCCNVNLPDTMS